MLALSLGADMRRREFITLLSVAAPRFLRLPRGRHWPPVAGPGFLAGDYVGASAEVSLVQAARAVRRFYVRNSSGSQSPLLRAVVTPSRDEYTSSPWQVFAPWRHILQMFDPAESLEGRKEQSG